MHLFFADSVEGEGRGGWWNGSVGWREGWVVERVGGMEGRRDGGGGGKEGWKKKQTEGEEGMDEINGRRYKEEEEGGKKDREGEKGK